MLEVNIFQPDGEVVHWEFYGSLPRMCDLSEFIKAQYPKSLGAEYIEQ